MRTTCTVTKIHGAFNAPKSGTTIPLAFSPAYVGIAIGDVVTNSSRDTTGTVSAVGAASVDTDVFFECGDFYNILLTTAWIMQTSDGLVIDVECKVCGFSFPADELIEDVCKTCLDEE